jgi:tetratricopeptide (TPR) repeat protein
VKTVQDERNIGLFFSMTFIVLGLAFSSSRAMAQASTSVPQVAGLISRIGDTTHLEFRGRQDWTYDSPKKDADTIRIVLPAFDDRTIVSLQTWSCPLIKKIDVNKNGPDGNFELTLHLANKDVESFDYLTDDPSYLVFDFYKPNKKEKSNTAENDSAGENAKPTAAKKASGTKKQNKATVASEEYKKLDRKPASDEILQVDQSTKPGTTVALNTDSSSEPNVDIQNERGIFDGGDPNYNRFRIKDYQIKEEAVIASQQNSYIRYPMLALHLKRFEDLTNNPPIYEIKEEDSIENKEARFLLTLFNENRTGTFFKVYDYFNKKYPQSRYEETVKNLGAEEHIRLYLKDHDPKDFEAFRSEYQYLVHKFPTSVLTERNQLLVAYSSLLNHDGAETIRNLQLFLKNYPNSKEKDYARIAMAEAFVMLNKHQDALNMYDEVIKDPLDKHMAVEAEFRKGDVYFDQKNYEKAVEAYNAVLKKYPQFKATFPNAQYNLSEAEFWLGKRKESLDHFIDFVTLFPNHPQGGFALTRIGELLQILGADQSRVMGAFVESYFRYPNSQGSEVARIKMLSQELKGMKEREKKRALEEINEIASKSELPEIKEFTTLVIADGLSRRGEYKDSLDELLSYFRTHPTTTNLQVFKFRILRNLSDILKQDIDNGKFIDALNFYGKYSTTWLKNAGRIDTDYYQAYAFELAGAPDQASKTYLRLLNKLSQITGSKEEKERRVYEHLPTADQINLRLAACATTDKQYREAFTYLKHIKSSMAPVEEVERVQLSSVVAEQMGDNKAAIRNLEKLSDGYLQKPEMIIDPELHLIHLYLKEKEFAAADTHLKKLEKMREDKTVLSDDQWAQILEMRGDMLLGQGQKLAAVQAYENLLDAYETTRPLASIRYKCGKILFEEGDLKGAEKIWAGLDDKTGELYKKLAQEKLHQAEWQDTYKKYIDRIPAAQDLK